MNLPAKIGKYDIQGILGKGGMGVVYRAFDPAIHRQVAIKTITKSILDPSELQYTLKRFRHEAQAVGRLTHPSIAAIFDYGEDAELAYIVMELVSGKSLAQHLQNKRSFALQEIGEIIRQLLEGLGYAHARGVIHRDVKPPNILLNDDGRIKITDFGIARIDTSTLTQIGEVMGSPGYMSPEQFAGNEIDARSDIYSAGVIAYELLTGRKPFIGSNAEIMHKVVSERPADPSQHNPALSVQTDLVVQKALAKKREERYQSAQEFAAAFVSSLRNGAGAAQDAAATAAGHIAPHLLNAARMISGMQPADVPPAEDADAPPGAEAGTISVDTGGKKARLLFVDDEERILSALRSVFRARYHVFTATNGPEALEFTRKFKPHVVVSDQRMPDMPGVELLRLVKEASPHTLRILLTGYSDLAAIVGSINEGEVYRFIAKPWDNRDIQKIVAEAAAVALELAEIGTAPRATAPMTAGILVVDPEQEIFRATRELFGADCSVSHARNMEEAFGVLQAQEIALILADIGSDSEESVAAFKLLKQAHPEILVMAITAVSDSELMIELINQAQIFRFLNKPVNLRLLKQHVQAALNRYRSFKQTPQLVNQHRVAAGEPDSPLGRRILGRVKSLRDWFGSAAE
jgi:response regulator RpfG family c-di-GMP phosphodiesterase/tRNA A-37 threonylcarbamoyl transferase component Bud32